MTQHQAIQFFLPILVILPLLYFRMRKMARARPLKLKRMWIRPVLFLAVAALVLLAPQPAHHPMGHCCPVTGPGWVWRVFWAAWRVGNGAAPW